VKCSKVSEEVKQKCKRNLDETAKKKRDKQQHDKEVREHDKEVREKRDKQQHDA